MISGGVTNWLAMEDYNEWKGLPENDPRLKGLKDSADTKATAAYVMYGVGGAAVAGGIIWYFVAEGAGKAAKKEGPAAMPEIEFIPMIGTASGAMIGGRW